MSYLYISSHEHQVFLFRNTWRSFKKKHTYYLFRKNKAKVSEKSSSQPYTNRFSNCGGDVPFHQRWAPQPGFWRALGSWFFFFDDLHGLEGCVLHVSGAAPKRWCLADFFRKTSPNRLGGSFFVAQWWISKDVFLYSLNSFGNLCWMIWWF